MNKDALKAIEVSLAIIGLGLLFAALQFWIWVGLIATMGIVIGIFELISIKTTGKTISLRFQEADKKTKAIGATGLIVFFAYLILHLLLGI
jgi:hypothetical protein